MHNEENLCALCNNVAKHKCSACQVIYYCNREHQKMHWKKHSKNCQPCKVSVNARLGRHFIATRNIKVGEVVLYEKKPLVIGPYHSKIVCVSCCNDLTKYNRKPCGKCGWPLCINCKKHGPECEFIMKYRKAKVSITADEKNQFLYKTIILVRALALRESDPEAYKELLRLEDHSLTIATKPNFLDSPKKMASVIKNYFKYEDVAKSEIAKMAAIIQINGYSVEEKHVLVAVYGKASYVEHNCRANCSKRFTADYGIIYSAAVPISKGDHISTCYINAFWTTMKRRQFLARTKFFDCTCERCKDPTEFGTMFSAYRCFKDGCTGFMLPPTFLVSKNYPDFVCHQCNFIVPWKIIFDMENKMDIAQLSRTGSTLIDGLEDACNAFFEYAAKVLHKNHSIQIANDITLIQSFNFKANYPADISHQILNDHIVRVKKLIAIIEILAPGEESLHGSLMYALHQTIIALQLRQPQIKMWKSSITELKEMRAKAYKLLHRHSRFIEIEKWGMETMADALFRMYKAAQR